jgi:hypothetical protein
MGLEKNQIGHGHKYLGMKRSRASKWLKNQMNRWIRRNMKLGTIQHKQYKYWWD